VKMNRLLILLVVCITMLLAASAYSATYTFAPTPSDMGSFDPGHFESWGVSWQPAAGERIVDATIMIRNANSSQVGNGNVLRIHLLDNPASGVKTWNHLNGADPWASAGPLVGAYTDGDTIAHNIGYSLSSVGLVNQLNAYAADGTFGFGFDSNVYYSNGGVLLTVTTAPGLTPVPEPSGLLALAVGLNAALITAVKRRRKH
jgi:hypothetical protein